MMDTKRNWSHHKPALGIGVAISVLLLSGCAAVEMDSQPELGGTARVLASEFFLPIRESERVLDLHEAPRRFAVTITLPGINEQNPFLVGQLLLTEPVRSAGAGSLLRVTGSSFLAYQDRDLHHGMSTAGEADAELIRIMVSDICGLMEVSGELRADGSLYLYLGSPTSHILGRVWIHAPDDLDSWQGEFAYQHESLGVLNGAVVLKRLSWVRQHDLPPAD